MPGSGTVRGQHHRENCQPVEGEALFFWVLVASIEAERPRIVFGRIDSRIEGKVGTRTNSRIPQGE